MKKRVPFIHCLFLQLSLCALAQKHTISGYVREAGSGELLPGATVSFPAANLGVSTNAYGFYSLTLPAADSAKLVFSSVGYRPEIRTVALRQNQPLDVALKPASVQLREVTVTAPENVSETERMSVISILIRQIKEIPALMGEKDVLKVLQLMPGVQKGTEGTAGIYVRGGGPDQNLLILDDAVVYNANHLFGFFSVFNGDALKSVELTKGGFPARFGGRLSSVVEMQMKEGNKQAIHGEGGIGLLSSRFTIEGPLRKDKASFLFSGRRSYADLLLRPFMPRNDKFVAYFYDAKAKISYDFGRRNRLYLSGYFGRDNFYSQGREADSRFRNGFDWGSATATLRWNHLVSNRLFVNTALVFSNYLFRVQDFETDRGQVYRLEYSSGIRDFTFKSDFDFQPSTRHSVKFGVQAIAHRFRPSAVVLRNDQLDTLGRDIRNIDALETAAYVEDTWQPLPPLKINAGLRYSYFRDLSSKTGGAYHRPEPRLSAAYRLRGDWAVKASYATMNQYLHLLSNTGLGLPTDLWVPATSRVHPQQSRQVALGIAKDFTKQNLALTVEGYYKKMDNIIAYREGASFLTLDVTESGRIEEVKWEDNVTAGQGWAYGSEVLLQRKFGRLSGWIGYTLSWTTNQFDDINFGRRFFARYDRRHDVSVVAIYKLREKITLSGTWLYGTGNALTVPIGRFSPEYHGIGQSVFASRSVFNDYGQRNGFRAAPYHRLDMAIQFHKKKRWGERIWELSVYNAYMRANPFYYSIRSRTQPGGQTRDKLYYVALFPLLPSFSYNFKF